MTAMTSDERREVAAKLRQMADEHDVVHAFDNADIRKLSELIDQTCKIEDDNPWMSDFDYVCRACGEHFSTCDRPNYCPGCGARVVSDYD